MTAQRIPDTRKLTSHAAGGAAADDRSVRIAIASKLNQLIDARGLSQAKAGEVLGMPQPKISAIRNLKLSGISLERLLQALAAFDQHVDIVVGPSRRGMPPGIRVDSQPRRELIGSRSVESSE
jgi:predicted XRE-type DNA-binding protein